MVYFSSNSDYFQDLIDFSSKCIKRYSILLENLIFSSNFIETVGFWKNILNSKAFK